MQWVETTAVFHRATGKIEDEVVPVAIIPVVPERKRSRSHELTVAVLEAAEGVTGRGARQRK